MHEKFNDLIKRNTSSNKRQWGECKWAFCRKKPPLPFLRHDCCANPFPWPSVYVRSFWLHPSSYLCQSVPQSPALPYVTGAHIRENNLWHPWIRDAVEFPMIQVWYGNSLKYLDSRELSDQCSPACCWQTHVSETSCQEDPWDWSRRGERNQKRGKRSEIAKWCNGINRNVN